MKPQNSSCLSVDCSENKRSSDGWHKFHVLSMILIFTVGGLWGCHRNTSLPDPSNFVVEPGFGVTNICEIGMSHQQLLNACADAKVYKDTVSSLRELELFKEVNFCVLLPALGGVAYMKPDHVVSSIVIHAVPFTTSLRGVPEIKKGFSGKVGNVLSFSQGAVTRHQVESFLGVITQGGSSRAEIAAFLVGAEPYRFNLSQWRTELNYPKNGISFVLDSNVVVFFRIYPPRTNGLYQPADKK